MPDQTTPLDQAIAEVIQFARAHGVDAVSLEPRDFGHQPIGTGYTTVTYVDGDHVIVATIDRYGYSTKCVGTVEWIHSEADQDRDPCVEYCGECHACRENPCACPPEAPEAYRDKIGQIRRRSDGHFIALADATRETLERRRDIHAADSGEYSVAMAELYTLAIALLDQEAGANA